MKYIISILILFLFSCWSFAQQDSIAVYKKRVLEKAEIDFLSSYYAQDGNNASVTGGIGTEELTDFTPTFIVSMPLNDDDVLTAEVGISAYTSASSSNLNPFSSGASSDDNDNDDDDDDDENNNNTITKGSPWVAASGASSGDVWFNTVVSYSHSSDDRNSIWNANVSFAAEYDYTSIGFGGGYTKLFNQKNTEVSIKGNVFLDTWNPQYPTEIKTYYDTDGNLNAGFFEDKEIFDQNGLPIIKNGTTVWTPSTQGLIDNKSRNTYALSLSFSQVLNKNAQISLFADIVSQQGWLANPMQRVYFADYDNYYMGNPESIPNYTSSQNRDVFQLADDIERLPDNRFKLPIGLRFNYYFNEIFTLRTYYRYYFDDWGVNSHTASIELPIKLSQKFTLYPSYRFYSQTAANYFAPYEKHLSTSEFYTSDYDLSKFSSNQYGFGISYTDIFTKAHIWKFHIKSVDLKYSNYSRNSGLKANIISGGIKFVFD